MPENTIEILERMRALEAQLEDKIERRRAAFKYKVHRKKVVFEKEAIDRQKSYKTSLLNYLKRARILIVLSAPFIYVLIIPVALLDILVTLYQTICFPIYGIAKVRRADYIAVDHTKLQYLNALEKLNCVYCSYSNGLLAYATEIAARTEQYWCPIKHSRRMKGSHHRYPNFLEFGDDKGYRKGLEDLRRQLTDNDPK